MDHGDTDFPSQNFQLTGEESNKFPQGLRSLPLPKFDIDEHLQGHLRFDSLVETEGLLAIQGQGNNWIEDFTPVGSEIEYSSTAAESCLISRPKNVWSDATSSESVEMLLKSVVEDEMIEHSASLKEGVVIDGLEDIDGRTDAYLSPNNSNLKTVGSIVTAPLLPNKCQEKLPLLFKDVNRDQFQVPDSLEPCGNDKPEVYRDGGIASDKFNYKTSIIPKDCTMTKVSTLSQEYATKTSSVVKQATRDGVQGGDPSHNEYGKKCTAGHPLACTVTSNGSSKVTLTNAQDDLSSASTSNLILTPGKMYCHMFSEQVNEENSKVEQTEKAADAAENGNSQIKDNIVTRPHFQASAGRSGISSTGSSSLLDPSTESLIHLNERCNELEVSDNPRGLLDTIVDPVMALNKERQIEIEPPTKEIYSLSMEGEGNMYPSCLAEGQNRCDYTKPLYFSKDDAPHAESTLPVEKINVVDKYEGTEFNSLEEVIEDIQNPNFEPTDNVNRHDEDTSAMESTVPVIKSCSLVMEGDRDLDKISVGTVCKDITKLSCFKEACNSPGSSEPLHLLRNGATHIENTFSVEDINTVDVDEGTQLISSEEATKGKQDPNFEPTDSNNRDVGDTFIDEIALSVKNTCPLSMNGDGNMGKTSVQIIKDMRQSCSTEGSNSFEYCKPLNILRDISCVENPISRENNIMVSKYEGTKLSSDTMIKEDRDRIREFTDAESVKVHSSNNTSHGMVGKAKQDASTSLSVILAPQNCYSTVIAENCTDEVSEYVCKESGFRQNAHIDVISEQRLSSALLDDADKRSNALGNRLSNKCDSSELVAEPHNVIASAPELLPSTKENTASPMNSGSGNAKCDMLTVAEKDAASCAGQKTAKQSVRQCLSVKKLIKDESGNDLNHSTNSSFNSEDIESNMLKSESANPSTSEQHCGSPTVLTCSRHSHEHSQEGGDQGRDERGMDPTYSVSDDMCFVSSERKVNNKKIKSCSSSKESTPNDDRSFTFKVGVLADLSEKDTGNKWKSFPAIHSFEPQLNKLNLKMSEKSHIEIERELQRTTIKAPDEDSGQVFGCSSTQRIAIPPAEVSKGTPTLKQSDEEDIYPCTTPKSFQVANRNLELEEMEHYPCTGSNLKESCSAMPDLITSTTSTSAAELFHQPFTKLQQVQLRAQIFVYGSIMQATLPDEAHMISAFGETDGGRGLWEGVWLVSAERFQFRTSPFDTPSHSHSVSEQVTRSGSLQRKASRPPSQSGRKAVSSATVNSTLPLPSPVRSASSLDGLQSTSPRVTHLDFSQGQSPVHSHHSSQIKQYTGNDEPCLFEFPRPGSVADVSQNSAPVVSSQHSTVTVAETNQVTPVRDSVVPLSHVDLSSKIRTPGSVKSLSAVSKSRKRKKDLSAHQEFQPTMLLSQCQSELISHASIIIGNSVTLTSSGLAIPANSPPKVASGALASKQRAIFSEETCSNIEQARLQAEDASALAASAVSHSQGIWGQLATQKNSGLISEVDKKLACAAIAAAAAAAVAKAAAAAAKVASDASLQAKLMADEALNSVRTRSLLDISEACPLDMGNKFSKLTSGSILTGKDKDHGSSAIISVARKAARKRVEAASAATKRAENMDAIVRAAELAAEAVSQAGKIIALDEPLPFALSKLVEASPEGHGTGQQLMSDKSAKANSLNQVDVEGSGGSNCQESVEKFNEQPTNTESRQITTNEDGTVSCNELPVQSEEHYEGNRSCKNFPTDGPILDHLATNSKENSIQKGCLAEVSVDKDGFRGAWFSAHVLDVKDGKAYICYDKLVSDEGNTLLKEWISLEGEGCRAPRIRLAHPTTVAKCAGTRKRHRETTEHYVCNVGDRVDAWIRDGWWEGIVTEKSQGSDTTFTVHFPDGGNSSTFRAWNLRPSLVWKDGYWIESSHARGNPLQPSKDENPQVKRQKLDKLEPSIECGVDGKGINKISNNIPAEDLKRTEDSRPAILSLKDRTRSAGKNARLNNSFDALRVRRTSRHKERSGVVIGVPKPGKNRKFMEVSKHYMKDKTDTSEGNVSNKFAKDLMPQTSRIWRSTHKVDSKGKDAIDSKPKVLKSVKSRTIQSRRAIEKENSSKINSSNNEEERDSYASLGAVTNPDVGRSGQPVPLVASFMKNSSPAAETDIGVRGNVTPFADKSSRSRYGGKVTPFADKSSRSRDGKEDTGKTKSDIPEPRRSVRRIQPTSRLLEGLQSSLTISRIPSFSRDKVAKPRTRGASSSGNAPAYK